MTGNTLYRATWRADPVEVGHATGGELAVLGGVDPGMPETDLLDVWTVVAIRAATGACELHALGWRIGLRNSWITSPLIACDPGTAICTASGHRYGLGRPDGAVLHPGLRSHLGFALRTWGYGDVR